MVCLGVEPGAAGWNPLSYGSTPQTAFLTMYNFILFDWNVCKIISIKVAQGMLNPYPKAVSLI